MLQANYSSCHMAAIDSNMRRDFIKRMQRKLALKKSFIETATNTVLLAKTYLYPSFF